ncbi:putative carbon-nitrogen hydrolase [Phaeomoniella chlamydospora]|uniref:Putative carbon-nitrogen hydrolase n=1 Tax=Phaeomoniella chlamydospora TaxID=158046 RepID=A0A0G2DZB4_PHACM|nr:putative carbon-nitrogen hydrolase [Phaeomoniella chlamydospora]
MVFIMPFTEPATNLTPLRPISILVVNPNSTKSMTEACIRMAVNQLPSHVTLTGFTAPAPSPSAIEGSLDAILSSEACIRALASDPKTKTFDAILVACFSKHALIEALREELSVPVIGIMEAALYSARMLGGRFGIVATGERSKWLQSDAVRAYGLDGYSVGSEATGLGVLELETKSRSEVLGRVAESARVLVDQGADCVLLGCAGMTDMVEACKEAVAHRDDYGNPKVNVIDGVVVGVQLLIGLVTAGFGTAKGGMYRSSKTSRDARGQKWL